MSLRSEDFYRNKIGKAAGSMRAMIRRMTVKITTKALWQVIGYINEEESAVEVFSNVGFYSRPPESGGSPEVVVLKIGGKTAHSVIVASRDERTRQKIPAVRDSAPDESVMHNSVARVHVLADGTVVVDDCSGAVQLALKTDVDALESFLGDEFDTALGHTRAAAGSPPRTAPAR